MYILFIKKILNLYISYELDTWSEDLNKDFTLSNCLFGALKLTKNADSYKYKYSSYNIGYDSLSEFLWTDGSIEKMLLLLELIIVPLCILMVK